MVNIFIVYQKIKLDIKLIKLGNKLNIVVGYQLNQIIGFDETTFYLDMPGNYTYEMVGAKRVLASTTGHEKVRVSVLVIASASGNHLPMICIIKRKTPIPGLVIPHNCIVVYCSKGMFLNFPMR